MSKSAELVAGTANRSLSVFSHTDNVITSLSRIMSGTCRDAFQNWLVKPNQGIVLVARVAFALNSRINASPPSWTVSAKI